MATQADLYAALYGVPLGRLSCGLFVVIAISPKNQPPQTCAEGCKHGRGSAGRRHCRAKHAGRALMGIAEALGGNDAAFWQGAKIEADAEDALLLLESATPAQLLKLASEDL